MAKPSAENTVRNFLKKKLLPAGTKVQGDTALFEAGYVDSFGLVELIVFLEKTYGFKVKPLEVSLENLGSVTRIVRFLERKGFS